MTGFTNMLIVLGAAAVISVIGYTAIRFDGLIQKARGVPADRFGNRPLGKFGTVILGIIAVSVFGWFVFSGAGGEGLDPIRH